jgi:hypothetical protein
VRRNICVWAAILAIGLATVSAAAASQRVKHSPAKKTHVVHHSKAAAKKLHASKPAVTHKTANPKAHKTVAKKVAGKSHAKELSRLQKRRA